MNDFWIEVIVILVLLVANGILAMTEIAVISSRKPRLLRMAEQGNPRAKAALELVESPNRFLATVQIGITLVGIFAGAFGGATIAEAIGRAVSVAPALAPYGTSIGLAVVVIAMTYLSLVIGELAPKRIGMSNPEGIAMIVARPMRKLSILASPAVKLLSLSTDALLRIFYPKPMTDPTVTEDEVSVLMEEGLRSGAFNPVETEIVTSALELDQMKVRDIMTPRLKITWLNRDDPHDTVWHKIVVSGHSSFPVCQGNRDTVVGVVSVKAIYANLAAGVPAKISDLMIEPLVVPVTQTVIQLLETFRRTGKHIAMAADEFGGIEGIVTLNDVMQAVLGDFPSIEERLKPEAKQRNDGTWLIDGLLEIDTLEKVLPDLEFGDDSRKDFQTLAGFVVKHLRHVPLEGEKFETQGYIFEVIDMDRHRVDKVLVTPAPDSGGAET